MLFFLYILLISYISAPVEVSAYRAYRCEVRIAGREKIFLVNMNALGFYDFKSVNDTITRQTDGGLVFNHALDNNEWKEFANSLLLNCRNTMMYQRPARNIGKKGSCVFFTLKITCCFNRTSI